MWLSSTRWRSRPTTEIGSLVSWIDPAHLGGFLGAGNVQVDHHRLLAAADDYGLHWFIALGVDLLVGDEWRDIDKVTRPGFFDELEPIAPAHASSPADNVQHSLDISVMMGAGFGIGL